MFKNARKVHVDGQIYYWVPSRHSRRLGKTFYVAKKYTAIQAPDGNKFFPTINELLDSTDEEILKNDSVWSFDYVGDRCMVIVTPGMVKKYIELHIHGKA